MNLLHIIYSLSPDAFNVAFTHFLQAQYEDPCPLIM